MKKKRLFTLAARTVDPEKQAPDFPQADFSTGKASGLPFIRPRSANMMQDIIWRFISESTKRFHELAVLDAGFYKEVFRLDRNVVLESKYENLAGSLAIQK